MADDDTDDIPEDETEDIPEEGIQIHLPEMFSAKVLGIEKIDN